MWRDCNRAVPGRGFPRQYNLKDHIKRVHTASKRKYDGTSPTPITAQAGKNRRRRLEAPKQPSPESCVTMAKPLHAEESSQFSFQMLAEQWIGHRRSAEQAMRDLGQPEDSRSIEQIAEAQRRLSLMASISRELVPCLVNGAAATPSGGSYGSK